MVNYQRIFFRGVWNKSVIYAFFFYFILEVLSFSDFYLLSSFPRFWGILSIQPLPAERQIPL